MRLRLQPSTSFASSHGLDITVKRRKVRQLGKYGNGSTAALHVGRSDPHLASIPPSPPAPFATPQLIWQHAARSLV